MTTFKEFLDTLPANTTVADIIYATDGETAPHIIGWDDDNGIMYEGVLTEAEGDAYLDNVVVPAARRHAARAFTTTIEEASDGSR